MLLYQRAKITKFHGISLPDGRVLKRLIEGGGYKYLVILKADWIRYTEMKEKMKTEYLRRVRNVLETKLNGGNIMRYSAAFID